NSEWRYSEWGIPYSLLTIRHSPLPTPSSARFLHPEDGHELEDLGILLRDHLGEVGGRQEGRPRAELLGALGEFLARNRLADCAFERRDYRLRRALRHGDAAPKLERHVELVLARGRHIGKCRIALGGHRS